MSMTGPQNNVAIPASTSEKVALLTDFFGVRLLLKRYRKDKRDGSVPAAVVECESSFQQIAVNAVAMVENGIPLDAVVWADMCSDFSARWIECCHWVSPRKLREFFASNIGAVWTRVDDVPASKEQPPVDLKWYKSLEGSNPVQPCMCPLCNVVCNSKAQYTAHAQGRTHKTLARAYAKKNGCSSDVAPVLMARSSSKDELGAESYLSSECSPSESSLDVATSSNMSPPSPIASTPSPILSHAPTVQISPAAHVAPIYLHPVSSFNDPLVVRNTVSAVSSYHTAVTTTSSMMTIGIPEPADSFSAKSAKSAEDEDCGSLSGSTTPFMNSVSSLKVNEEETTDLLSRVSFELCVLQNPEGREPERIAQAITLAQPLLTGDGCSQLMDAVLDAALRSENSNIDHFCAKLMRGEEEARRYVQAVVAEMVARGFGEKQQDMALLEQTCAECHFSTTYDCARDILARHKAKGLARLVCTLVAEGLLREKLIVQLASRPHPSPEALFAIISAVLTALPALSSLCVQDVRARVHVALSTNYYPTRVHTLAASL